METALLNLLTAINNLSGAAQLAHWNVTGPEFPQYHELFARIYGMASANLDPVAEQTRGNGIEIPAKIFHDVPELEWSTATELVKELYGVVEEYCDALNEAHKEADKGDEYGILNIVEGMMTESRTLLYLLGSTIDKI
jgi:DNA-binding ferritin-like protein